MRKCTLYLEVGMLLLVMLALVGCSKSGGPDISTDGATSSATLAASAVVSQDLAQLTAANVTSESSTGVFSIGWKKFVGPNITNAGTIGEAYAVVRGDTTAETIRPLGLDLGSVTLSYDGGSVELTKRTARNGSVLYETFGKGMRFAEGTPVNIPFVANGVYTFTVSGSAAFSAATFPVTAPAALMAITGHADGVTVLAAQDLTIGWTGGSAMGDVLVRLVPHLRPAQLGDRPLPLPTGDPQGGVEGPRCRRQGRFAMGGPLEGMGPEFARGVVVTVPNTGSYTVPAADLQTLLSGTRATELMVSVAQVVESNVVHDGKSVSVVLRDGDRIVLQVK